MFNSEAFRRYMYGCNVSQAELVQKTDLSRAYISALVNGKVADPSLNKARLVAHALGLTIDSFYDSFMDGD